MMSSESKVWFITGCSSGFGLCIAEHALKRDDQVVATLRNPGVLSQLAAKHPERLLILQLDVTKPAEVIAAFVASREKFGRVDVVVNNAGFGVLGEVESTTESSARGLFDVNFWGASHVSKEALRFFREENKPMGGRLLQVSSYVGIKPWPGFAYYCARYVVTHVIVVEGTELVIGGVALECLSEVLAEELDPNWNIKVNILQPGPFRTKIVTNLVTEPIHPAYTDPSLAGMQRRATTEDPDEVWNGNPAKFAEVVYRVAYMEDPPLRLPVHPMCFPALREKGKQLLETANKWESWSEDMLLTRDD